MPYLVPLGILTLSVVATLAAAELSPLPAERRIYIANDDHTDYMWAADAATYDRVFVDMLDFHLDLIRQTKDAPFPHRSRFNTDGSYWLRNYEKHKPREAFLDLIEHLRNGSISSPLNTLVSCYGGQPTEAVLRGLYYAGRLERRHGLRFELATAMENQTLPLGLASLFAGSGARYSWRGVCACASKIPRGDLAARDREIYWYAGHDGARLLMKWYSVALGDVPVESGAGVPGTTARPMVPRRDVGIYAEARAPRMAIAYVENDPGFRQRHADPVTGKPYGIYGLFGFGGDAVARKTGVPGGVPEVPAAPGIPRIPAFVYSDHFHDIAREQSIPGREVIVSNQIDFFEDFARHHGASLETHVVTYGNEWDLYSASMAETSARVRRSVEKLRAAEALATLVGLKQPEFSAGPVDARDEAYHALGLYWEHNWTADGRVSAAARAAWQEQRAQEIESYVDALHGDALLWLRGLIANPGTAPRFLVFNPLGWTRSGAADLPYAGTESIQVRDVATGAIVPHEFAESAGVRTLRILASGIPAVGYKTYEVVPAAGESQSPVAPAARVSFVGGHATVENDAIKVVFAPDGAVRSFIDKRQGNGDLAAEIDGLWLNDLAPFSEEGAAIELVQAGPVSVTLRATSRAGLPHVSTLTLYRDSDRVDLDNEIEVNFADVRHWSFSFNLEQPTVHTEEVGAINLNRLRRDGGAYADRLARYDYITLNHFADISDGTGTRGMTLSNADLAFARLGRSTPRHLDTVTAQISPLAGGQVDAGLGVPAQNGETRFRQRFALRPHGGYDPVAAMRFALEHQNPFVTAAVTGPANAPYPPDRYEFLRIDTPGVLAWAVKPADDGHGHGVAVRLWNVTSSAQSTRLSLATGLAGATFATHIETPVESAGVDPDGHLPLTFAPQQIRTVLVRPAIDGR